jgi:predicted permease
MPEWTQYVRRQLPRVHACPERENEIIAELGLQLEAAYEEAIGRGLPEAEAVAAAEAQVASWDALAREINAAEQPSPEPLRSNPFGGWRGDVRYALRSLRRNPAFSAIAVLTLAFGIGGNTAIFTVVDAVALRGLPYRDASRLMAVETRKADQPELEAWTSALDLADLREHARSFQSLAGISPIWNGTLTGRVPAERLELLYVSHNFFDLLGVEPALGRTFTATEDASGHAAPVAVISHSLWQRQFAGSMEVLGKPIELNGVPLTVIGVMPAAFRFAGEPVAGTAAKIELYLPLSANQLAGSARGLRFLKVVGRLKAGVSAAQARDEIHRLGAALSQQYPATDRGYNFGVQPLSDQVSGRYRVAMYLLLSAVGFVLLMACANVANLLLGRATARQREISMRVALGASRYRLLRQLLTEGAVLAALGGVVGLAIGWAGLSLLVRTGPEVLLRTTPVHLDGRALAFTCAAVFACALLAGLPPAWRTVRSEIGHALRESARGLTGGHRTLRSLLVVTQMAFALILLVGAGLLIRSFEHLLQVDPGFNPHNLVTVTTQLPASVQTAAAATAVYKRVAEQVANTPEVISVAAVSRLPLMGRNLGSWLYREGRIVPGQPGIDVEYRVCTPSYFQTMGIPLRAGRLFDDRDGAEPLIVNEAVARRIFPGENPVGQRVKLGPAPDRSPWVTIVGVVGNVRHAGLDVEPSPEVYRPYAYNPLGNPILVIRTAADPSAVASTLYAKVRVDPAMPAYNLFLMQDLVDRSTVERRFIMLLLSGFAAAALLLAAVGVYGTVAQTVAQRTSEIGLRMALGASPGAALYLVFRDGLRLTLAGMAIGAAAAALLTRLMRNLLFEIRPLDVEAFALALLTLAGIALLACYIPARRATRIDPLTALRQE